MTTLNNLIQSGELPSYMQGARRKVRVEEIGAYLDRQAKTQRAAS
ncbi:MAG: helix-turn-helix domain-containing protein [Actinomycetota bacterium]|nr:helix-turn-helix domain-containing protein [Actinomycetota bacterium]